MKKTFITILLLAFVGGLTAQNEVKLRDIECYNLGDGRYYCHEKDNKKPLNGKSRIIDGYTTQYTEVVFKDGIPDGSWKTYKYNKLSEEYNYENGLLNGDVKMYYSDETVKELRHYIKGKPDGKFIKYSPDGKIESEKNFKNGKEDGAEIHYDSNGKVRSEERFVDGKAEGKVVKQISSNTGDYVQTANYKNGKYEGEYSEVFTNGNVKIKGNYVGGKKNGSWEYNKKDGQKIRTDVYAQDEKIKETIYYTDGTVEVVRELKNGKKNGWERKYVYGDGGLRSEMYYQDGEVSSVPAASGGGKEKGSAAGSNGMVKQTRRITSNVGIWTETFYKVNDKYEGEFTEEWLEEKTLKTKGQYTKGIKQGNWIYFLSSGKKEKEESYIDGKLNGPKTTYTRFGTPSKIYEYKNDERDGSYKLFLDDGTLQESGTYVKGRIQGLQKRYDSKGKLTTETIFPADVDDVRNVKEYYPNGKLRREYTSGGPKGYQVLGEYDETGKKTK